MKRTLSFILLLIAGTLAACAGNGSTQINNPGYEDISVADLEVMMAEQRDSFVLINTHIPFEGNIPDTDLSIPFDEITDHLNLLPNDKNAQIVLYCRSDSMSRAAARALAQEGYTNVKNLMGGFIAWQAAGLPLEMEP